MKIPEEDAIIDWGWAGPVSFNLGTDFYDKIIQSDRRVVDEWGMKCKIRN